MSVITYFGGSRKLKKKNKKKYEKKIVKQILEENKKYIYIWEEYTRTSRKLSYTSWERSKYIKLKNSTVYSRLIKALLVKKNSI